MARKDEVGRAGEERAARVLRDRGYEIVDRNWRCEAGELDIVALRADVIAAVEVKTRSGRRYGHPFEAIGEQKLRRLWRLAHLWAREHPALSRGRRVRVDAVALIGADPWCAEVDYLEDLR